MNLLLFTEHDRISATRIRVTDHRLQHLREVIDSSEGDTVRVGEISGRMGEGRVVSLSPEGAVLEFKLTLEPPAKLPLTLVLALPRPKMLRRILRTVAELGVESLHLVNSYRVEKSYWQSPVLKSETVEEYFLQGLSQLRDTVPPTLSLHRRFKPFAALEAERVSHLAQEVVANRKNGKTSKKMKSTAGPFELNTPRDRAGTFEPQLIKKHQTSVSDEIDAKILSMYGLGMSYRDIAHEVQDIYGISVSTITARKPYIPSTRLTAVWQNFPGVRDHAKKPACRAAQAGPRRPAGRGHPAAPHRPGGREFTGSRPGPQCSGPTTQPQPLQYCRIAHRPKSPY